MRSAKRRPLHYIVTALLVILMAASGWYLYNWYTTGDDLGLSIPGLSTGAEVDESEVTEDQKSEHQVGPLQPRYLSIPSIGVENARIFGMGVTENNQLADPANIFDIAWYKDADTPGSGGVSLLNGHNGGTTKDGIFAELRNLSPGDEINVERGDGEVFRYAVRENNIMPIEEVNEKGMAEMLKTAEEGAEGLNIITCDGFWVPSKGTYSHRVMLRAVIDS